MTNALRISCLESGKLGLKAWSTKLRTFALEFSEYTVDFLNTPDQVLKIDTDILIVDENVVLTDEQWKKLESHSKAVVVVALDDSKLEVLKQNEFIDDFLIYPLRRLEVFSCLRRFETVLKWEEVTRMNASLKGLLEQFHQDLSLAERMHRSRLPSRFKEIRGFKKITTRYLAGMKAGGDYFDVIESPEADAVSVLLTDSSSYGLSSAVSGALLKVAVKLSGDSLADPKVFITKITEDLKETIGEKDQLSLFFGTLSRKDWHLKYMNLGNSRGFILRQDGGLERLLPTGEALSSSNGAISDSTVKEVILLPENRLIVVSDGFLDAVGGEGEFEKLITSFQGALSADLATELAFRVKSKLKEEDDLPPQDCSIAVLDVEPKVLRLTR